MMKAWKRLASVLASLVLLLGCFAPASVFAAEEMESSTIPEVEYVDGTPGLNFSSAPSLSSAANDLSGSSLDDGALLGDLTGGSSNSAQRGTQGPQRSPVSITQSFTGYFAAEGDIDYIILDLDPGVVVQATLQTPPDNNIDYTLYL